MKPDFEAVRGCRLLAALSGGADSTALLTLLADARAEYDLTLFALHVEHGIRGQESQADAAFCERLCETLGVPLTVERVDVPRLAREWGEGMETAARRARYDCLRRARDALGARYIVLAHHRDDQAETVLMHLLRGCGPEGIGGMRAFSGDLYRPLLDVSRAELESFLRKRGQDWRTDSSNLEPCTPRNKLRLHGLPALEESYPGATLALTRYAEAARREDALVSRIADDFFRKHADSGFYGRRLRDPETADEAILRRCLRRLAGNDLTHARICELSALCQKKRGRMTLPGNRIAERTPCALYVLPEHPFLPPGAPVPQRGNVRLEGLGELSVQPWRDGPIRDDPFRQALRKSALDGAVLRTRRDGDRMRYLGCGDRLVSDILTDRKIDRPLRDGIPMVAVGGRVLWIPGVGISEDVKLRAPGEDAILLEWRQDKGNSDDSTVRNEMEGINHGKGY